MNRARKYGIVLLVAVLALAVAGPAGAEVVFRCPGYVPGVDGDVNTDGQLRASDGEISSPLNQNQVCMHLTGGDGFITLRARPAPQDFYIFSFDNVTGVPDNEVLNMWDAPSPGGVLGAQAPAPTIELLEGDEFFLSLTNVGMLQRPDLFDPHTVHWHGFPNASAVFDGVPDNSISIGMGATLTYYYNVVEPGTFMYHCHVEATEHMQMGMLGNLWVRPSQDVTGYGGNPLTVSEREGGPAAAPWGYAYNDGDGTTGYDQVYPIQIGSFDPMFHDASRDVQPLPFANMKDTYPLLNGRGYPDTVKPADQVSIDGTLPRQLMSSAITATAGERILLRISNLNVTRYYTVGVLGMPMQVVGNGSKILRNAGDPTQADDMYYNTSSVILGGGESMDVLLDTTGVAPGTYFLYTKNLNYLSNDTEPLGGMMTEIVIN